MYFFHDSQFEEEVSVRADDPVLSQASPPSPPLTCSQGHRSSLLLQTQQGGSICLLCFSNLVSSPNSPTFHVSYALSQLSEAISEPSFLHSLLTFHAHIIISPLADSLSSFDDEPIARQIIDLVVGICSAGGAAVLGEFVARISDLLSSGALAWSRRQVYTLHCLGELLDCENLNPYAYITDKDGLINNLVVGLQLPSEEIQGEILFVLYRISLIQCASEDDEGANLLSAYCPKLLRLSLEVLMKSQSDEVRLNCVALLKVLAQRGFLENAFSSEFNIMDTCEADNFMETTDDANSYYSLSSLLAEAIKAPLLSADSQVQITSLDFIFHCLSREGFSRKQIHVLVEENVVDYIFEILRISKKVDQVVSSCILVLYLFSKAEEAFRQRLALGFTTLVSALPHIAEVPFHPVQTQMLELIMDAVSKCPEIVSAKHVEEIGTSLTMILRRHVNGEIGMVSEAFISVCSIFVGLMTCPSSAGTCKLSALVEEASRLAVLASLSIYEKYPSQFLQSLYLLKETCAFIHKMNKNELNGNQSLIWVMEVCQRNILPWFMSTINEIEEESILGVLETFHYILDETCDLGSFKFVRTLLSLSWFSLLFGCLGLYPTEKMKCRVYFMFSSIVDCLLGNGSGQPIRDVALALPADPIDMLYLLGQKSVNHQELSSCQIAVIRMLHISSLYNEMVADRKLVLAALEQYILVNSTDLLYGSKDSSTITELVNLYGLYRGLAKMSYQISYSPEAEKIFFKIMNEKDMDLFFLQIHQTSLKWLFQQERIYELLSCQILKLCKHNFSVMTQNIDHGHHSQFINMKDISELVAMGDNLAPRLLVVLLKRHSDEELLTDDFILVLNLMTTITCTFPAASDQICMNGLGNAMQNLCYNLTCYTSSETYVMITRFIFIILSSVQTETLADDEAWLAVIMKLLDSCTATTAETEWTEEGLLLVGVLSLILRHSIHQVVIETSKFILLNNYLASTISSTIKVACAKGSSLVGLDETTKTGQALIFLLVLNYFYFRSMDALFPGRVDWKLFLNSSATVPPFPSMGILCHDFCRLMYSGALLVKLLASYCIQELFANIMYQRNKHGDLNCNIGYLKAMVAVMEGLIFDSDIRVAMNCGITLLTIWSWEELSMPRAGLICSNKWCRMIVEELAVYLAAPCSLSKSFLMHHKPAAHVAAALLNLSSPPEWMRSVFNYSTITSIIRHLSPENISGELVLLFRLLLQSGFLNPDHISSLSHVFQVCRKEIYTDGGREASTWKQGRKSIMMPGDLGEVCGFLVHLVSSESPLHDSSNQIQAYKSQLSAEIDLFFISLGQDK